MTLSTTITTICSKLKRSHIALFTAIISLGYASISQSQVITYENCNYTGKKADVPIGSFTWPNLLRDVPNLKDNDISSIKVSNGYKATLYADPNYKGKSITVTGDVDCLIAKQFNDTMSSIKVEGPTTQPTESQTRTQAPTKSNRRSNTLLMGESLPVGQSLRSLNGTFTATMGANCEFGVYAKMANPNLPLRALWTSESKNKGSGCYLELQKVNGHLVVFDENRSAKWASGLFSKLPGKRELTLKNDGDLVLTQNGNQIWSTKRLTEKNTKVVSPPVVVNSPRKIGNTLQEGSALKLGEKLTSSNGEYSLMLHQNCTLSVDKGAVNLWKTDKSNKIGTCRLYVSGGNLMLRTQGNSNSSILETIVWAPLGYDPFLRSKAPNQRARLVIQDDGYLLELVSACIRWDP